MHPYRLATVEATVEALLTLAFQLSYYLLPRRPRTKLSQLSVLIKLKSYE